MSLRPACRALAIQLAMGGFRAVRVRVHRHRTSGSGAGTHALHSGGLVAWALGRSSMRAVQAATAGGGVISIKGKNATKGV